MKDDEARRWLRDIVFKGIDGGYITSRHNGDLEIVSGDRHVCFEYENSSRGMVSHVCKHYHKHMVDRVARKKILVFIRTDHHIYKYFSDHDNAMAVAIKLDGEDFRTYAFNERSFMKAMEDDFLNISKLGTRADHNWLSEDYKKYEKKSLHSKMFGCSSSSQEALYYADVFTANQLKNFCHE